MLWTHNKNLKLKKLYALLKTKTKKTSQSFKVEPFNKKEVIVKKSKTDISTYNNALQHYKQKNYKKAYELFSEAFTKDMGNKQINFYLGRSAYEIGMYEIALSAYERVFLVEPTNVRVKLEIAQTYLAMKLYTQAKKEFSEILQNKLPVKVREKIENSISFINNKEKKHFVNNTLIFGFNYDSNINNSANASDYSIYFPALNLTIDEELDGQICSTGYGIFVGMVILRSPAKIIGFCILMLGDTQK